MNPHQQNKIDVKVRLPHPLLHLSTAANPPHQQSLSPDEQRLLRMYGKIPNKKDLLQNKLKVRQPFLRSYFLGKSTLYPTNPCPASQVVWSVELTRDGDLQERKYFDSGDYALSKAGKASDVGVTSIGSRHPVPENIPHLTATSPPQGNHFGSHGSPGHTGSHNGFSPSISRSPVKEGSFLRRSSSEDKEALTQEQPKKTEQEKSQSPPPAREGLPIRR